MSTIAYMSALNAIMTTVQVPGRVSADRGGDGAGAARLAAGLVRLVLHTINRFHNRLIVNGSRYDSVDKIRLPTKLYVDDRDDNVIKVIELSTKLQLFYWLEVLAFIN